MAVVQGDLADVNSNCLCFASDCFIVLGRRRDIANCFWHLTETFVTNSSYPGLKSPIGLEFGLSRGYFEFS